VFKFKPHGPFEIPVEDGRVLPNELKDFWKAIERDHPGLQDAVGCYIFGIGSTKSSRPWYVGKTERASFKREAFQPQKLLLYQDALREAKRGTSLLFLIARVTDAGKFRKSAKRSASKKGVPSIGKLEELLIGAALMQNGSLVNQRTTKHLKEIHVPGYMNEAPGARSLAARHLAKLLGT
jgi:hypothetical protein